MQKNKNQENQTTKKYILNELIFLEMQNSSWYSLFSIITPINVFFQNAKKIDLQRCLIL